MAAHPDDEVLGAGGILAILAAAGVRVRLVAVTDGEGSHPDADPAVVARTRAAESVVALDRLGASGIEVIRLGFPDTGLAGREEELAAVLCEQLEGFEAPQIDEFTAATANGFLPPQHAVEMTEVGHGLAVAS